MLSASLSARTKVMIGAGALIASAFPVLYLYAAPRPVAPVISPATTSVAPVSAVKVKAAPIMPAPDPKNLPNFAEVAPGIYRGAAPTAEGWRKLHDLGIQTEIDLRIEKKDRAVAETATKTYGIQRLHLPMGREAPTSRQVTTFLTTLNDPARRPIFVHCQHGADRTGAMIGIYRETHDGWKFDRTYTEMRRYGFKSFLTELKGAVKARAPKV